MWQFSGPLTIKVLEQKVAELEKKVTKYEKFFANLDESIKKVVCDHLELDEDFDHYDGCYMGLYWDTKKLGDEICLGRYGD